MSWLLPGFLAGAIAIGLPVALHFLRSKPTAVIPFPTLRFLGPSALRDTKRNRLRRWLTLLLRCAAIALLAAAFARPFFAATPPDGGRAVLVVVDNSMSMQAAGRWEALKREAQVALADLQPGDRAGILLMNPSPQWLVPMGDRIEAVRTALRDLAPGYETTRCQGALRLAGDVLARQPAREKRLFWMADGQRLGWAGTNFAQPLPPGVKLILPPPAVEPAAQAAILGAEASAPGDPAQVTVTLRLFSPATAERTVTLFEAGGKKPLGHHTVSLTRGEPTTIAIPLDLPAATSLPAAFRIELDPDDLPADDSFYLATGSGGGEAVAVRLDPASGVDFLAHALRAAAHAPTGSPSPFEIAPLPEANATSTYANAHVEWPAHGVVLLRGESAFLPPQAARLDRFLHGGGSAWVLADGGPAQTAWLKARGLTVEALPPLASTTSETPEPRHLQDWDPDHPLLAAFAHDSLLPLLQAGFRHPYALKPTATTATEADRIAAWDDGSAALVELGGAENGGKILVSGFGLTREETDWPVQASFVPFVDQAVRWLASAHDERSAWRIGETIPFAAPGGLWSAVDSPRPLLPQKVGGSVRPTVPGLYRYENGGTVRLVAVNVPQEESDLAPWPEPNDLAALQSKEAAPREKPTAAAPTALAAESEEAQQRLWWWLMAAAALCLLGELGLANRTSAS